MKENKLSNFNVVDLLVKKFNQIGISIKPNHATKQKLIKTKIGVFDDVIGGILETDLILIGASTGLGKTQLAMNISKSVADQGHQCVLFSLESYDGEIEDRMVFSELCKIHYAKYPCDYLSFKEWVTGNADKETYDNETAAIKKISDSVKNNLRIRYRDYGEYTVETFCSELDALCKQQTTELIVIDHLHYFDAPNAGTENAALSHIMKKLRDIGLKLKIPIILIAHLRKKDKSVKVLVPDEQEFHGSSEISKNATSIITIAPADIQTNDKTMIPTYFRFPKLRFDEGGKKRYLYCSVFNLKSGEYEEKYRILWPKNYWCDVEEIENKDIPKWATKARLKEFKKC